MVPGTNKVATGWLDPYKKLLDWLFGLRRQYRFANWFSSRPAIPRFSFQPLALRRGTVA
jgi:hypothetical protein